MRETALDKRQWLIIAVCCLFGVGLVLLPIIAPAQSQPGVRLYGYVTDATTRTLVAGAYLDIRDETGTRLTDATTNASGYYDVTSPAIKLYSVGISVWVQNGDYQVHGYMPTTVNIVPGGSSAMRTDIALQPAANLVLNLYGPNGELLRNASYGAATGGQSWVNDGRAYVTNIDDIPCDGRRWAVQDPYAYGKGWDLAVPAFVIPLRTATRIHVLWEVPGFGRVVLDADNAGAGYQLSEPGGYLVLSFPYEAAKTAIASLRSDSAEFRLKGYSIPDSISNGIQSSVDHLAAAERYLAQTPQAVNQASTELNLALKDALWTHETLVLELARNEISRLRRGTVRVGVHDEAGQPIAGATVIFKQTNRDFLFGANPPGSNMTLNPRHVTLLREAGINHSYVFAPWENLEPSPGRFQWDVIDASQDIYSQLNRGFTLMGGLALWMYRSSNLGTQYCPKYQDDMSFAALQQNVREHMRALGARYAGKIELWEMNEPNISSSNVLKLTWDQKVEIYRSAIAGLKEGDPNAKVLFNSPALPYEFAAKLDRTDTLANGIAFPEFLRLILSRGIPVDAIGLEMYYAGVKTDGYTPPGLSLVQFSKMLDTYSRFGRPIFITEFSAPSIQYSGSAWWHRPWDVTTQSEFATAVYSIAFSKQLVRQIGWAYGISDDNTFIRGGGLLDASWTPKPVYYALKDQLNAWNSSGTGQTDATGTFLLSGYAGDYDVTITAPGRGSWVKSVNVREQQSTEVMTAPEPAGQVPVLLSADVASYQESRNGKWFSEDLPVLPPIQSDPDLVLNVKDSVVRNRRNGGISPTLVSSYYYVQDSVPMSEFKAHLHTATALFLKSGLLRFVDYLNNKVWLWDNTSGTIPTDILGVIRLCNESHVPVFLQLNYSDYIPGPTGSSGVQSLEYADNVTNTISFLETLTDQGLRLDGVTFGNQMDDDSGLGAYKPTMFTSDMAARYIRYARAIKSRFPSTKIYAFESSLGEVYGHLSSRSLTA